MCNPYTSQREFRFVLTQRCNYTCEFCHGETLQNPQRDLMNTNDWITLFRVSQEFFGHNKVTFTGGEPLIRKDVITLAKEIYICGGEITITTNGYFLEEKLLIGNYIKKLNVSLHSLDQEVYSAITHGEKYSLHKVIYGIQLFREKYPHVPVVLNVALVEGVNSELKQIKALVNLATQIGADIKFIELYPKGVDGFIPLPVLSENLNKIGFSKVLSTFRKMSFTNGEVQVALTQIFCSFAENEKDPSRFCQENNDLFVTPEGKIKPCRHSMIEFDLKKHLTDDANLDGIKLVLDDAIRHLGARCILGK